MKHLFIVLAFLFANQFTNAQNSPAFWPDIANFQKQDAVKAPVQHAILFGAHHLQNGQM